MKTNIVGAGLVGSLLSIVLKNRGFEVNIYERRSDQRKSGAYAGRSINLALSDRGIKALQMAGIESDILDISIPMYGRAIHAVDGKITYQPYGKDNQAIYSVSRGELNFKLMDLAEKIGVKIHFNQRCSDIDLPSATLKLINNDTHEEITVESDKVFSADGAFSAVRSKMQTQPGFNYSQEYLKHGYKELTIPPDENGNFKLKKNALHIWPRGTFMLIALPNPDGSFTCTLFLPYDGEKYCFNKLNTDQEIYQFFNEVFPDTVQLIPDLVENFKSNPTSHLVMIKCEPWNYEDKVLLLGDASHAIVPFYGQGMNSGFEDCSILNDMLQDFTGNWKKLFSEFAIKRKPDADAILALALQNFIEMRDLVGDTNFLLRKKIEAKFSEKYPDKWIPLYTMVTFTNLPYSFALKEGKKQDKIMDEVMQMHNIHQIWNTEIVEQKMLELLHS
jgi:kynurenine 3-monooxygenase